MENEKMEAIELSDAQTEKVSGGATTAMECSNCHYSETWGGYYYAQSVMCPMCGKNTFTGIHYSSGGLIRA